MMAPAANSVFQRLSEGCSNSSSTNSTNSDMGQNLVPSQQVESMNGPVAIFWDFENCPIPSDVRPEDVAGNIRMALRVHPVIRGAVTSFSAYGDFNAFPRRLREGCQRTGVKLIDVPHGRKDAADKAILIDMFLFALDNPPPSSILLISGDVDFSPALHVLGQRGYTIILVIPAGVGVSSALSSAGRFVWDWPSVSRGEGFVPAKIYVTRSPDVIDNLDLQNEEDIFITNVVGDSDHSARRNVNQMFANAAKAARDSPGCLQSFPEHTSNVCTMPCVLPPRSQGVPSSSNEVVGEQNEGLDSTLWVQPGDVQGLKGQMVRLLELSGGSLPLVRVPAEYNKMFGRPLYKLEYGECKLVNLMKKLGDVVTVEKKGNKKMVCLRKPMDQKLNRQDEIKLCPGPEPEPEPVSEVDENLEKFRRELQELLVIYGHKIRLDLFKAVYEQRYKKALEYPNLGAEGLEDLLKMVGDVAVVFEDEDIKKAFVVAR